MCLGMPIGLRSMIQADNQGDWYRKMYNSLHRQKRHNHYNNRLVGDDEDFYFGKSNWNGVILCLKTKPY